MRMIIIGSGPAGISAALYARRAGAEVTVISKGGGALASAELIENYYGLSMPISGAELAHNGIDGARRLGVHFETDEVMAVLPIHDGRAFRIEGSCRTYECDAVILAEGKRSPLRGSRSLRGAASATVQSVMHSFTAGKKLPSSVRGTMPCMRRRSFVRMWHSWYF